MSKPTKRARVVREESEEREEMEATVPPPLLSPSLSTTAVTQLASNIKLHHDTLLSWLANEKATERKDKLRSAIVAFSDAFSTIANAYTNLIAVNNVSNYYKDRIERACNNIAETNAAVNSLAANVNKASGTYASVVGRATTTYKATEAANKVSLSKGKSLPLSSGERVIIGPCDCVKERFSSALATKEALFKAIDPVKLKIKINRVSLGPKCAVIVEGNDINAATFSNCSSLAEAGLEVKSDALMDPRIVVHDIPVELSGDDILHCIIEQNLPNCSITDLKLIYLYPARNKKLRSCVLQIKPELRLALLSSGKVSIKWSRCRVDDHISILQCFNCFGFGHVANACKNKVRCGKCAGEHSTKDCASINNFKCINCTEAKHANSNHAATDKSRCPILCEKIKRKLTLINYGQP